MSEFGFRAVVVDVSTARVGGVVELRLTSWNTPKDGSALQVDLDKEALAVLIGRLTAHAEELGEDEKV